MCACVHVCVYVCVDVRARVCVFASAGCDYSKSTALCVLLRLSSQVSWHTLYVCCTTIVNVLKLTVF